MQQFLIVGSGAALAVTLALWTAGISIMVKLEKPTKRLAYVFFVMSVLMLALYVVLWNLAWVQTSHVDVARNTTGVVNNIWPLWLSAIGTTLLAVMTFVVAILIPWWKKPKFTIEFDNVQPFCRETTLVEEMHVEGYTTPIPPKLGYWLRLRVTNSGKSVAKRCIGKLVKVMDNSGRELTDYDPVVLHWVGTSWEDVPFRPIDLNREEHEFLDVLVARTDSPGNVFMCTDTYLRGIPKHVTPGTYRIQITIYGDNVKPRTKEFRLIWGGSSFRDVRLEEL